MSQIGKICYFIIFSRLVVLLKLQDCKCKYIVYEKNSLLKLQIFMVIFINCVSVVGLLKEQSTCFSLSGCSGLFLNVMQPMCYL